jgi:hypothetical protein
MSHCLLRHKSNFRCIVDHGDVSGLAVAGLLAYGLYQSSSRLWNGMILLK